MKTHNKSLTISYLAPYSLLLEQLFPSLAPGEINLILCQDAGNERDQ